MEFQKALAEAWNDSTANHWLIKIETRFNFTERSGSHKF